MNTLSSRPRLATFVLCVALVLVAVGFRSSTDFDPENPLLSSYFVPTLPETTMDQIAQRFEVHRPMAGGYEVIVPAHRRRELLALAPKAKLLEADIHEEIHSLERMDWAGYHDVDSTYEHLKRIATEHPDIAKLESYGKSKNGRSLWVLKLSDNVNLDEKEPEVMLTAATHGNELITVEVLMGLIDKLTEGYKKDARLTALIDGRELFFIPVVNADGYAQKTRYANGVDPNREYPYPGKPDRRPNECIKAIIDFFEARDLAGSIDFHSTGRLFMYPWAYTRSSPPEAHERRFRELAKHMAAANGYRPGQISKILYPAAGSSADYYYWKKNTIAMAVEIGTNNVPAASQLPQYVKEHEESTWRFLESFQ